MRQSYLFGVLLVVLTAASVVGAQATWDGPTGAFLNPLAFNLPQGKTHAHIHYLNLQPDGGLTTYGVSHGLFENFEIGLTRADLAAGGLTTVNILHGKYVLPSRSDAPHLALGAIVRDTEGGGSTTSDFYLAATKIFPAKTPIIASVTLRETDALGGGLFGRDGNHSFQFGAFLGVQVTPQLIVNVEYRDQPDADAWADVGVRYLASPNTTVDVGLAHINDAYDNQLAGGITHVF